MTEPVIIGNATHIYALMDECGSVRYVGKTTRTLDARFKQHRGCKECRKIHKRTYREKAHG